MFAFEKGKKEESAIQILLMISQGQNDSVTRPEITVAVPQLGVADSHSLRKRHNGKLPVVGDDYQLSPWDGSDNERLTRTNHLEGRDQKQVTRSRDTNSTNNKRSTRFKGGGKHNTGSAAEEKFRFCYFEESREYITHYRESITFSAILDYRNGLSKSSTPNTPGFSCKKCECDGITKQCQCSSAVPASSGVYYVEGPGDAAKRHSILAAMRNLSQRSTSCDEKTMYRNLKRGSKDQICHRRPSPETCKLWKSTAVGGRIPNRSPTGPLKSIHSRVCKHKGCKTKSRCHDIRIKTGNESPEALRIYTSPKAYGPRMGSNRPPLNDASEIRGGTPPSQLINCLRPKIPQAAIPNKNTTFQACIMPMNTIPTVGNCKTP